MVNKDNQLLEKLGHYAPHLNIRESSENHCLLRLSVKIRTNGPKNAIKFEKEKGFTITVTALPIDGKANEEIINFLTKSLKIAKSQVSIISGETSKLKIFDLCLLYSKEKNKDFFLLQFSKFLS
jgi:uncharacterized protein (TIGR00251 family)